MASSIQLLRSTNPQERPFPGNLLEGQPAANLHSTEPGLFFKTTDGSVVKFGPAAITSDGSPPNSNPLGSAGNSVGELWLDKSFNPPVLRVYDGSEWVDAGSGGGGGGGSAAFLRWIYVAQGGETSLSGSASGVLLEYTAGLEEVFVNGVLLTRGDDYSALNGTSITNLAPLSAGDVVTVLSMNPLEIVQLPGEVTLLRWTVLASAGQTALSGIDSSGQQLSYTAGFEAVYVNGVFLRRGDDYTATNGSTISLATPLTLDDEVTVMAWSTFEVGNLSVGTDDIQDGAVTDIKIADVSSSKVSFTYPFTGGVERTVTQALADRVNVTDFGADPTGASDSWAAISAAISAAGTSKVVWFPGGRYRISQPIRLTTAYQLDGDRAIISPTSDFTPLTVPTASGGTEDFRHLICFIRGNARDIGGARRPGGYVGRGLRIDGRDPGNTRKANGVYIERTANFFIGCEMTWLYSDGIETYYSWGGRIDSNIISNFPGKGIILGKASNGVDVRANVFGGDLGVADYCIFMPDFSDNNGVNISGCYLERAQYGVYCGARTGPVHISGVDFEVISQNAVWGVGDPSQTRICGPIHIDGCYLDSSSGSVVKAEKTTIRVTDCRFRTNPNRFETDTSGLGNIIVDNCFSDTGGGRVDNSQVKFFPMNAGYYGLSNYSPRKTTDPYPPQYFLRNYQFGDSRQLMSSAFEFKSQYQGGGTNGRYLSLAEWWISEYRHESNPDVLTKQIGVKLDNRTGQSAFNPWTDNSHKLGEASARWSEVFAGAPAINTSDSRLKQQVRDLSEAEKAVALRIKKLVKAFKFNEAVAKKGEKARIHVGVIAQEVAQAFEAEGLDPQSYSLFCYDEWEEIPDSIDEEGNVTVGVRGGNQFGIRYEELLAFIISAI